MSPESLYDAVIVGSGYTGTLTAIVLARQGYRVALIERGAPPRTVLGETTTPEQNLVHRVLGRTCRIRELSAISSFNSIKSARLPIAVWPKEAFFFHLNQTGDEVSERCEVMHQGAPWPNGPDYHCFRADYDLYLLGVAQKYGAAYFGRRTIGELSIGEQDVRCELLASDGAQQEIKGRFLIDASGPSRFLAGRLDLEDSVTNRPLLRTEAVYSHFLGVKSDDGQEVQRLKKREIQSRHTTRHYLRDDGFTWLIPFDNGLTSVGAVFNLDRQTGTPPQTPAARFQEVVAGDPALQQIMAEATAVDDFQATGLIQGNVARTFGRRWMILPPASGLLDPLVGPGMALAAMGVARLVSGFDASVHANEFSEAQFGGMQAMWQREMDYIAKMQHIMYDTFGHFDLFFRAHTLYRMALFTGAAKRMTAERPWDTALLGFDEPRLRDLVDDTHEQLLAARSQGSSVADRTALFDQLLQQHDWFGFMGACANLPQSGLHTSGIADVRAIVRAVRTLETESRTRRRWSFFATAKLLLEGVLMRFRRWPVLNESSEFPWWHISRWPTPMRHAYILISRIS